MTSFRTILKAGLSASVALILFAGPSAGVSAKDKSVPKANPFSNLKPRMIGPAHTSGRISDFAVHPQKSNIFYVATSSGGIWKTVNNGITWTPIFDRYGSYAIGNIEMDPSNSDVLWAGTGENNSQRSVANGDGIYKSTDGGKSWSHVGLKNSGHISTIWINPENGNHVRVASQGPLWSSGGDRGLFETHDGGKTWKNLLEIDEHTGVNEFVVDLANPDHMVVSSYQRRRHVWTLINGGPGSGIHRTTDGGKTWTKVRSGLPGGDLGRIGLAAAPSQPGLVYAIIEANKGKGIYVSENFGVSWTKRSSHMTTSPQYYNELFVDPKDPNKIYSTDTFTQVSKDGGRTWKWLSVRSRHVDDHALWINPKNTDHLIIGGDGGVYESYDAGDQWRHMGNLPIAQFYRITPDNSAPFYNVCGGTQDNNSLCAPSRTTSVHGILNHDWQIILGGDGYKAVFDPEDPNIIYTQYQYGGLARFDKRTSQKAYITPQPASGENKYKWNWNTPIIVSPHKSTRIYYAAEKLFKSDDRGDNWTVVSPDLTRQLDRNKLKVMDRVWSVDAIAKNDSTSIYGSIIGLSESSLKEGLLYIGTDDGLIQITEDGGKTWRKVSQFKGVPDMSLIEDVVASVHDENVAYAAIDNHKRGDYKPYLLKTTDKGKKWKLISKGLPARGSVHTIAEDHRDPNLLFAGTEYGLFFTQDGGDNWTQIKNGFPTIAVRDLEIQRRENDLVIGTFGRGIYILDDYSPLRLKAADVAEAKATLFSVKDAWQYIPSTRFGNNRRGSRGDQLFSADNPDYGAIFTYHLGHSLMTEKARRMKSEGEKAKKGEDTPYPTFDVLRRESVEEAPAVEFIIRDEKGAIVRKLNGRTAKGMHRVAWDLRHEAPDSVSFAKRRELLPWESPPRGALVVPGRYTVELGLREKGKLVMVEDQKQSFTVKALVKSPEETEDRAALTDFMQKTVDLEKALLSATSSSRAFSNRLRYLKAAILRTPALDEEYGVRLRAVEARLKSVNVALFGDSAIASINEPTPMSIRQRVGTITGHWGAVWKVPGVHKRAYKIAASEFAGAQAELKAISEALLTLEAEATKAGAPHTPGRLSDWSEK
ncbi:glycosyl hydrolase [Temperatibacter marinus]|uniref:Glycosyl hydrolase n=1 Tax=Temperatibacter marinus TaxID=1456591 RepID=A0AA52H8T8_9PROT|nr:glycosyl hydrolase [Temperatibacter marinus]WND01807.1 glycosyl hydrolase [Temperatibacter marinus]